MRKETLKTIALKYKEQVTHQSATLDTAYKANVDLINFSDMFYQTITMFGETIFGSDFTIIENYCNQPTITFSVDGNLIDLSLEEFLDSDLFYPKLKYES